MQNYFFVVFQLLLMLQLVVSSFSNYQEAILSSSISITEKTIDFIDSNEEDTYGIGFWSMCIPLRIQKKNNDFDISYNEAFKEFGELLLLVKDSDTNNNLVVVYKILDYTNLQVGHQIQYMNNDIYQSFIYNFDGLDYEGLWIFHLIMIQPIKEIIMVKVNGQSQYSDIFKTQIQQNLKIILGGRGYINNLNLNNFRGLLSNLIYLPNFYYEENAFENIMLDNQIPQKYETEQKVQIVKGFHIFNGQKTLQSIIDQYGSKYCLYGWVKFYFNDYDEGMYTFLRMTSFLNYEEQKKLGDELFSFKVFFSQKNPVKTQIIVNADAYSMPVQQSFQSQYDLTFQGIQNPKYQVVESTRTFENVDDFRYFEGLQQWHFLQYEYGRSNIDERMLLQIQFYNELGLIREQLGNDLFRGSFVNHKFNFFFGKDNNFLQIKVFDLQFQFNYIEDKELQLNCHFTCLTCKGPLENDCTSCDETFNRYLQSEISMCKCNQGYFDFGKAICTDQFYSSIQLDEIKIQDHIVCPLGYFRLPINDKEYECKQCPQQMTSSALLCADCYFYHKTWYLKPVCKLDLLTFKETQDQAFHYVARNSQKYDLYTIGFDRELNLLIKFEDFCVNSPILNQQCHTFPYYHLGSLAQMRCKSNYFTDIWNFKCDQNRNICQEYQVNGDCRSCHPGKYLRKVSCVDCPVGCITCQNGGKNNPICLNCLKNHSLIDNICQLCSQFCEVCQNIYDDYLGQKYLRCIKCIDDTKYILSLDGKKCILNQISNCVHAFQALKDDLSINTLDINYQPQFVDSQIITLCGKCETSFVYVFETNECVKDESNQDCYVGIGQLNENNSSLKSTICLSSSQQINQVVQFSEKCSKYNNNCQICLQTDIFDIYTCLECIKGYYVTIPSGICLECPKELKCQSCYSQHSILKDRWKIEVRAFYRKYIEPNGDHQYTVFGQSVNTNDYEVICSTCIDGFKLHDNTCIQYCSESCIECEFLNNKYLCNKCQYEQRGRRLTLINNECIECPENCALCRLRTDEEIQQINPLFNNTKYQKYTYQCLKSYQDQQYYYDEDFGLFIECKKNVQAQGCYKQLIISINLYSNQDAYYNDLETLEDDYSKMKFLKENVCLTQLFQYTTSFYQYENDEFYQMANSKQIKSIIIKITNKEQVDDFTYKGGYLKQIFSNNIFTLKNVEIEIKLKYESNIFPQHDLKFINFSKITLQGIVFQVTQQTKFIFTSYFQQSIILEQIFFLLKNMNSNNVDFQLILKNVSQLQVNNLYVYNVSLINTEAFMKIQDTNYPKSLILNNITIVECNVKTIFFYPELGNLDVLEINNVSLIRNNISSRFIQISQMKENGQVKLSNFVVESSKIFNTKYFFHLEKAEYLEIINFQLLQTQLTNTTLILLNRDSFLENIKFQNNTFFLQSFGILNDNNQLELNINQQFQNILFQDNIYYSLMKFIKLKKYSSLTQKIILNQLSLINNELNSNSTIENKKQVDFSLISIQNDNIQLTNFIINRGYGLNDLWLYDCLKIVVDNGTIHQEKYRFLGLHKFLDCQLKQVYAEYYSTTLKIDSSKLTQMKNLTFLQALSYNFPILAIDSADQKKLNQSEIIILQDLSFISNLILYTESLFETSLISIQLSQQGFIQIKNIQFLNNVFHQYTNQDIKYAAGLLFIICPICKIQLMNSYFQNNLVLNSISSIIYIETQELLINSSVFLNNSIFIYEILQPHLLWGFTFPVPQEVLRSIFDIQSISGIGQLYAEKIVIQNNTFINSSGSSGGSFSIYSYGDTQISIQDNIFERIYSYFLKDGEYGGAIYIDGSSSSSLNIEIKNIIGKKIFCRGLGGFLYLRSKSSKSILTSLNLNFENVYAQKGSLIYISYSNLEQNIQNFYLQKLILVNSQIGFLEFLDKFKDFSSQSEIYNLINNRALIYVEFGSLIQISDVQINSLILEAFLIFYETKSVYLSNMQIFNSQISNNLISITSFTATNRQLNFQNILFKSISFGLNISNLTNLSCSDLNQSFTDMIYFCLDEIIKAPLFLDNYQQFKIFQTAFCVYQEIMQNIDQSNSGLILFNNFTNQDSIQISTLTFTDIQCQICQHGLIFLQFQLSKSLIQQQLITSLLVQNSQCGKQGCLNVEKLKNNNDRLLNALQIYTLNYELIIRNYICQNNTGTQGTCLKINQIQTLLENSLFQYNEASQEGGSIYIKGNQYLIIQQSIIQFNKAFIGGGMYFQEQVAVNYQKGQTKILNNMAEIYGNDIASIPQQLSLKTKIDSQLLSTKTILSDTTSKIQEIEVTPYIGINGEMQKIENFKLQDF